jgi:hypothetical protein
MDAEPSERQMHPFNSASGLRGNNRQEVALQLFELCPRGILPRSAQSKSAAGAAHSKTPIPLGTGQGRDELFDLFVS